MFSETTHFRLMNLYLVHSYIMWSFTILLLRFRSHFHALPFKGELRIGYWGGGAKMPTMGSRSLGTKLGEADIVILIHCAIIPLKILNVYCLK